MKFLTETLKNKVLKKDSKQDLEHLAIQKKMLKYFIDSFRFSQGNSYLQGLYNNWAIRNKHISKKEIKIFTAIPIFELQNQISLPATHVIRGTYKELEKQVLVLKKATRLRLYSNIKIEQEILLQLLERDFYFLKKSRPGGQKNGELKPDSVQDPFASYTRKYIIEQQRIPSAIFTQLFTNLHQLILILKQEKNKNLGSSAGLSELLLNVELSWESKHPGKSFFGSK